MAPISAPVSQRAPVGVTRVTAAPQMAKPVSAPISKAAPTPVSKIAPPPAPIPEEREPEPVVRKPILPRFKLV